MEKGEGRKGIWRKRKKILSVFDELRLTDWVISFHI